MVSSDIDVSITECNLQDINIHWWRVNIQRSMLTLPVFNDISIYTYQKNKISDIYVKKLCIYILSI